MFSKQGTRDSMEVSTPVKAGSSSRKDDIPSIIAADLRIVGNLMCSGSVEVEGEIEGNVTCGNVTIRRTGSIKGDVTADVIQVDGEINGLVKGRNVTLSETGRITGMIMYEALSVKDGAYIDGQCKSTDKMHKGAVEAIEVVNNADGFFERSKNNEKVPVEA
jgi:cytoskeletal protein CcmA (bactofilin family)